MLNTEKSLLEKMDRNKFFLQKNDVKNVKNEEEVNRISSREVAEMMETRHDSLVRKIDDISADFREHKIVVSKYWVESSYQVEGQNKNYRCFLITRLGCDFLANKTTGTKGNIFTARYMDRFEELKEEIEKPRLPQNPMEILELMFKVDKEQNERIDEVVSKVEDLENNMPLYTIDCKELQALVRKVGIKALGGYKSPAYNNSSLRGRVYSDIQRQLKREFGVTRYEAIKRNQLQKAMEIVEGYKLPIVLEEDIKDLNGQITMEV